jgi:hypothetical protein
MWDEGSRVYRVGEITIGLGLPIGVGFLIGWQPWVGMVAVIVVLAVFASGWFHVRREARKDPDLGTEENPLPPKDSTLQKTSLGILIRRCWSAYWREAGK